MIQSTKVCEQCGAAFSSRREAAKFCSSSCRSKAHRAVEPSAQEPIAISYQLVKEGDPLVCGVCSRGASLDGAPFARIAGHAAISWPTGEPICRGCMSDAQREQFLIVRGSQEQEEQAVIDQLKRDHELRFDLSHEEPLGPRAARAFVEKGYGFLRSATKDLQRAYHDATKVHPEFLEAFARVRDRLREASILSSACRENPSEGRPSHLASEELITQAVEANLLRHRKSIAAFEVAVETLNASLEECLATYKRIFRSFSGDDFPLQQGELYWQPEHGGWWQYKPHPIEVLIGLLRGYENTGRTQKPSFWSRD